MASKTITQVPITRAEIYRVAFHQANDTWTVEIDYEVKDDAGGTIARRTTSLIPGAAGQTKIKEIIDTCVVKANTVEGT